jgi:CelD/BcsL family acetyltransferase involved in cellulose biosynthesis
MIEVKWIENIEDFIEIKSEWDKVLSASNADNPFLLSDFIISWWRIYFKNNKLRIFILENNGLIIGGVPLYIKSVNVKYYNYKSLTFIGDSFANITNPFYIVEKEVFETCFIQGLQMLKGWDVLDLQRIRMDFLNVNSVNTVINNKFKFNLRETDTNPFILFKDEFRNADEYLSTRGSKLRRNTRNFCRKAELIGKVSLSLVEKKESVIDHLKRHHDFTINSRILRDKKSEFEDDNKKKFLENLIDVFYENNKIEFLTLLYGDEVVAYAIGYRMGEGLNWSFTSYNPEYSKISPGYVLLFELIEYSIKNQYSYIDFYYGGNVFYKQQWSNNEVFLRKVKIFNRTLKGYLTYHVFNVYHKFNS